MSDNDGRLWVDREAAKQALRMTEEQFAEAVRSGAVLTHRSGKWTFGGRRTLYFIGKVPENER